MWRLFRETCARASALAVLLALRARGGAEGCSLCLRSQSLRMRRGLLLLRLPKAQQERSPQAGWSAPTRPGYWRQTQPARRRCSPPRQALAGARTAAHGDPGRGGSKLHAPIIPPPQLLRRLLRLTRVHCCARRDWASLQRALTTDPGLQYNADTNQLAFSCGQAHAPRSAAAAAARAAPLTEDTATAFTRHSRPGAGFRILLDFTGVRAGGGTTPVQRPVWPAFTLYGGCLCRMRADYHSNCSNSSMAPCAFKPSGQYIVANSTWNVGRNASIVTPPYSIDNVTSFSQEELGNIIGIWRGVSEDFAPLDVDVSTQEAGLAAPFLRVIFGGDGAWYGGGTGGAAILGGTTSEPVFVFTGAGSMFIPKLGWEAASHYIGHALVSQGCVGARILLHCTPSDLALHPPLAVLHA